MQILPSKPGNKQCRSYKVLIELQNFSNCKKDHQFSGTIVNIILRTYSNNYLKEMVYRLFQSKFRNANTPENCRSLPFFRV